MLIECNLHRNGFNNILLDILKKILLLHRHHMLAREWMVELEPLEVLSRPLLIFHPNGLGLDQLTLPMKWPMELLDHPMIKMDPFPLNDFAELLAEMLRPPTPPSSDQDSDGDTETKLPRLSSSKEEDKMLAKVDLK